MLPFLVLSAVLAGGATYAFSSSQTPVYEARSILIVGEQLSGNPDYNQLLVSQRLSSTYATVASTRPILEKVVATVGLSESADALARRVQVTATADSALLTIVARDGDPARAAAIANALGDELIKASPAIQGRQADLLRAIEADLADLRAQITATGTEIARLTSLDERTPQEDARLVTLEERSISLRSTFASLLSLSMNNAANLLSFVQPAIPPEIPSAPRPLLTALLAAIAGLLAAGAIGFALAYLDDTLKHSADVQTLMGLPTLAVITRVKGRGKASPEGPATIVTLGAPRSTVAEAYRALRTSVEFASIDTPVRTLLVTSPSPGDGKTVTAANLAVVFAQNGRSVLLIDADLRQPGIHAIFNVANDRGLTTMLRTGDDVDAVSHPTVQENLRILTTGSLPPNPAELLGSQRMRSLVALLEAKYELLIVDSPPVQSVTDAVVLSSFLDATLLVIGVGQTRRSAVQQAQEALARANANVLGTVLNGVPSSARAERIGYYGGGPAEVTPSARAGSRPST